ncbi:uncharacterized protein LOC118274235 [Spodoptera frugiperda]|uniref:Uncharacterized protein LOC118274235 n=1 Tax=Spodoptera frugiperda TaxID=7108 RepID=A0A9R0DC29_SPOFR|nr:uncharacterized protein LOC118274235 [Spodoptera frugiperda]
MFGSGIFVFGAKIFDDKERRRDAITALPLEMSWKIFSYLDPTSLQTAARTSKTWLRIISSNKKLRNRLNHFELAIKLGSESLANFYRRNKRKPHKGKRRNYLAVAKTMVTSKQTTILKSKRRGDDLTVYTKRFKLC